MGSLAKNYTLKGILISKVTVASGQIAGPMMSRRYDAADPTRSARHSTYSHG